MMFKRHRFLRYFIVGFTMMNLVLSFQGVGVALATMHEGGGTPQCGSGTYWNGTYCAPTDAAPTYSATPTPTPSQLTCSEDMQLNTSTNSCQPKCPAPSYYDWTAHACATAATPTPTPTMSATPTPSPTTSTGTCPTGQWWDATTSTCKSTTGDHAACTSPTPYWDGTKCSATMPTMSPSPSASPTASASPAPTAQTCPSGQWWDTMTSSCKSTMDTHGCTGTTPYWDGTKCSATMPTQSPAPSATPYPSMAPCPDSTQWRDPATGVCQSGTHPTDSPHPSPYPSQSPYPSGSPSPESGKVPCPALGGNYVTQEECGRATPVCAEGQTGTTAAPCRPAGETPMPKPSYEPCYPPKYFDPAVGKCTYPGIFPTPPPGMEGHEPTAEEHAKYEKHIEDFTKDRGNTLKDLQKKFGITERPQFSEEDAAKKFGVDFKKLEEGKSFGEQMACVRDSRGSIHPMPKAFVHEGDKVLHDGKCTEEDMKSGGFAQQEGAPEIPGFDFHAMLSQVQDLKGDVTQFSGFKFKKKGLGDKMGQFSDRFAAMEQKMQEALKGNDVAALQEIQEEAQKISQDKEKFTENNLAAFAGAMRDDLKGSFKDFQASVKKGQFFGDATGAKMNFKMAEVYAKEAERLSKAGKGDEAEKLFARAQEEQSEFDSEHGDFRNADEWEQHATQSRDMLADVPGYIEEFAKKLGEDNPVIAKMRATYEKTLSLQTAVDAALEANDTEALQGLFAEQQKIAESAQEFEALQDDWSTSEFTRSLKDIEREIGYMSRPVAAAKRAGLDVTDVENFLAQAKELVRTAKQNQEEDPKAAQLAVSAYATLHANAEPSFRALFAAQHNIFSSKQAKREGKETSGTIKRLRKYVKKVRDAGERSGLTADVKSLEQWNAALAKETNPDAAARLAEQIDATEQQVFDTLKLLDLDPKALSGNIASADLKSLEKTVENEQTLLASDPRLTTSEQKEAEALLGSLAGSDKEAAEALLVASPDLTKDVLALNDENKALTAIVTELAPNLPAASAENLLESNVELTKDVVALTDTVADVGDVSQTQAAALTVLAESLTNGTVYSPTVAASIEEKIETAVGEITKVLEDETLSEAVLAAQVQVVVDVLKEEVASAVKANDVDTLSRAEAYVDADVKGDGAALNDARFGDIAAAAQDGAFSALETTGAVNLDATVKVAQVGQMGAAIFDNADASIILHDELEGVTTPTIKDIVEAGFAAADVTLSATVLANTQTLTAFLTNEGILPEGVTLSATADIGDTAIILQHIEEHYAQEATAG